MSFLFSSSFFFWTGRSTAPASALTVGELRAVSVGAEEATIVWRTNRPASTRVDYGLDRGLAMQQTDLAAVTTHVARLTALEPETVYHFRVSSEDESENEGTSATLAFTTRALCGQPLFHRGDVNDDGKSNLTDAIDILEALFLGQSRIICAEASNVIDDNRVNISDAIALLFWAFVAGVAGVAVAS